MKTYEQFIFEAKSISTLYHVLSIESLFFVLDNNMIKSKDFSFISTTRSKMMNNYVGDTSTSIFKIELDGDKLSNKYKISPFTYKSATNIHFTEEHEEQIKTQKISNISTYIKRVILIKKRVENLKKSGWFNSDGGNFNGQDRNIPELLKEVIEKLKKMGFELYVQEGTVIKKDDNYIDSLMNYQIKKIHHGFTCYLRGFIEGERRGYKVMIDKTIPCDKRNSEIEIVVGYDFDNIWLSKDKNINVKSIEIPEDFKLFMFDFVYDLNDVIEENEKEVHVKKGRLKNITFMENGYTIRHENLVED